MMGMWVPGKNYWLALSAHQRRSFFSGQRSNTLSIFTHFHHFEVLLLVGGDYIMIMERWS